MVKMPVEMMCINKTNPTFLLPKEGDEFFKVHYSTNVSIDFLVLFCIVYSNWIYMAEIYIQGKYNPVWEAKWQLCEFF